MAETFVFTCGGGRMMGALVRQMRYAKPGRQIVGVDADAKTCASPPDGFDRFAQVPFASEPGYADRMMELVSGLAPAVLVPGSDEEAEALAPHRERFARAGTMVSVSSPEAVALMRDKEQTTRAAKASGCPVAETIRADSFDELRRAIPTLGYPERSVVIKPVRGRGRRTVFFVSATPTAPQPDVPPSISIEAIEKEIGEWPGPMLACEMIMGTPLTVDLLCEHGALRSAVVRRWEGWGRFPFPGQTIVDNPSLVNALHHLVSHIGVHGLIDADMIEAQDGQVRLLELNPRPSGSVAVVHAAGIPLFDMLFDMLAGRPVAAAPQPQRRHITANDLLLPSMVA
jgi:carbamoylphosphate synthase large subunit